MSSQVLDPFGAPFVQRHLLADFLALVPTQSLPAPDGARGNHRHLGWANGLLGGYDNATGLVVVVVVGPSDDRIVCAQVHYCHEA